VQATELASERMSEWRRPRETNRYTDRECKRRSERV